MPPPGEAPPPPDHAERLGRYQILGELGRGAMGRVLLAHDPELGREVAIKVFADPVEPGDARLERFTAEARITGQLEHPGIVPVHDVGVSADGQLFYVMKRVDGRSLAALTADADPSWTVARLLGAFVHICDAVEYAHHRGVLHQDLKPANVLIGAFGEVLVADWGLATLYRAGLRARTADDGRPVLSGSPGFIAPERILDPNTAPTPATDQWSLGAILYCVLAGVPPVEGETLQQCLAATVAAPPVDVRLRDADREVPDAIAEVCMRALARDPAARFADVATLGQAVRDYLEGRDRRERALREVARADALWASIQEEARSISALQGELRARKATLHPRASLDLKESVWADQAAVEARMDGLALNRVVWEQTLRGALSLQPDLHEAHVRLARHLREEVEAAERRRDSAGAARAEWLLRRHDRGHHRAFLRGTGRLTLVTEPAGAEVFLASFEQQGRRLVPGPERSIGRTPLVDVDLNPGSYRLRIVAEGRQEVIYPVLMERAGIWDGVPPGGTEPEPVWLPEAGELGEHEVYVPAGWFIEGGDERAPDGLSRRRVWVDGFVIDRFPVTNQTYLDFLNRMVLAGQSDQAERAVPRDKYQPAHALDGEPLFARTRSGTWAPPEGVDAARWARSPVVRISLARGLAFVQTRPGWRLPDELERSKATHGVDGRFFPWGDHYDPAFSNTALSFDLPHLEPVESFPLDTSVYGVRGMGGNSRDLCGNRWTEDGPASDGERLTHQPAPLDVDFISARGGAWSSAVQLNRAAARFGDPPGRCLDTRGLRLVRSARLS